MPSTMTLQEALQFKMSYGKYNGKSLEHISKSRRGYGYLRWVWGEGFSSGKLRRAIESVMKVNPEPPKMTLEEARNRIVPFGPARSGPMYLASTPCLKDFIMHLDEHKYADIRKAAKLVLENRERHVPLAVVEAEKMKVPNVGFMGKYKDQLLKDVPVRYLKRLLKWKKLRPLTREACRLLLTPQKDRPSAASAAIREFIKRSKDEAEEARRRRKRKRENRIPPPLRDTPSASESLSNEK